MENENSGESIMTQCEEKMTFDWGYYEVECQLEKGHEGPHRHEWSNHIND